MKDNISIFRTITFSYVLVKLASEFFVFINNFENMILNNKKSWQRKWMMKNGYFSIKFIICLTKYICKSWRQINIFIFCGEKKYAKFLRFRIYEFLYRAKLNNFCCFLFHGHKNRRRKKYKNYLQYLKIQKYNCVIILSIMRFTEKETRDRRRFLYPFRRFTLLLNID